MNTKEKRVRIWMAVVGVILSSIGMGLIRTSMYGSAPVQCLLEGISSHVPFSYGLLYILFNGVLFAITLVFGRQYIGVTTFVNWGILGYGMEYTEKVILYFMETLSVPFRVFLLVVGLVLLCFAVAVYIVADLGVSAYDAIALIMDDHKIGKFRYCRIFTDVTSAVAGYFMGGIVGVGTIITAFFMGPLIDLFRIKVTAPFLAQYQTKEQV